MKGEIEHRAQSTEHREREIHDRKEKGRKL